jgi:hypothetical protein
MFFTLLPAFCRGIAVEEDSKVGGEFMDVPNGAAGRLVGAVALSGAGTATLRNPSNPDGENTRR